jgi:hypothetical protein
MPVLQKSDYNTRERQQYIRPYVFSDNINSTIDRSLHISRPGTIAVKREIKTPEAVNIRLASLRPGIQKRVFDHKIVLKEAIRIFCI